MIVLKCKNLAIFLVGFNFSAEGMKVQLNQCQEVLATRAKTLVELGKIHSASKEYEKAKAYFEEATKQDLDKESAAWACMNLAKLYYFGRGIEKDRNKAFQHVADGCLKGKETPAMNELQAFADIFLYECLNVHGSGKDGRPLLFTPVVRKFPEVVELLLDKGANPNAVDNNSTTALHYAAEHSTKEIVESLLARGADVRAVNRSHMTVLHYAARGGSTGIIECILLKGADVQAVDNPGNTPLHEAAQSGSKKAVELLLAWGADLKAVNKEGRTALHVAAAWASEQLLGTDSWGDKEVVELLVAKGSDVKACDFCSETAYDIAKNDEIKALLT